MLNGAMTRERSALPPFERASCNSRLSSSSVPLCEKTLASLRRRAARLALRCARVAGASAVDVERPRRALDDLLRDHDLFYAFEARQVEHGVEQDTLTAARDHRAKVRSTSGFPLERLALRPVLRPVQLPHLALETEMITPVIDEPTTRPTNAPTSLCKVSGEVCFTQQGRSITRSVGTSGRKQTQAEGRMERSIPGHPLEQL
jgi:hypothetical protein